jgi:hypothetical protein
VSLVELTGGRGGEEGGGRGQILRQRESLVVINPLTTYWLIVLCGLRHLLSVNVCVFIGGLAVVRNVLYSQKSQNVICLNFSQIKLVLYY